jgi:hypothetical protein
MKAWLTTLILACLTPVQAQPVTLAWDASSSPEVINYRIYYGTGSGNYSFVTNTGLVRTQTVVLAHAGRWFFAATAMDATGLESDFSNEVEYEARLTPPIVKAEPWVRLSPVIERSTNQVDWANVTGAPTFFAATNAVEFFATRQLVIERVQRVRAP